MCRFIYLHRLIVLPASQVFQTKMATQLTQQEDPNVPQQANFVPVSLWAEDQQKLEEMLVQVPEYSKAWTTLKGLQARAEGTACATLSDKIGHLEEKKVPACM
jgi:hypothetical protein